MCSHEVVISTATSYYEVDCKCPICNAYFPWGINDNKQDKRYQLELWSYPPIDSELCQSIRLIYADSKAQKKDMKTVFEPLKAELYEQSLPEMFKVKTLKK